MLSINNMVIRQKTIEELSKQTKWFLEYAKLTWQIKDRTSNKIRNTLCWEPFVFNKKEQLRDELSWILDDDWFDVLYWNYREFLKYFKSEDNIQRFLDIIESNKIGKNEKRNLKLLIGYWIKGEMLIDLRKFSINRKNEELKKYFDALIMFWIDFKNLDGDELYVLNHCINWGFLVIAEKNLRLLHSFWINIANNLKNLGNVLTSKTEKLDLYLNKYPNISAENLDFFCNYFNWSNLETLKIIFEKYSEFFFQIAEKYKKKSVRELNQSDEILWIHNILYSDNIEKRLKIIFERYPDLSRDEFLWLDRIITNCNIKKLKIIFEKYPNISAKELKLLKSIVRENNGRLKNRDLIIILKKYPNITIDELGQFKNSSCCLYENLKIIFKKYPHISLDDLIDLRDLLSHSENQNLKRFFDYFSEINVEKLKSVQNIGKILLPKNLKFKEENHNWYLELISDIVCTKYLDDKKKLMIEKLVSLTFDEAKHYLKIFKIFDDSISMDVQRIKNELIEEVLKSDAPEDVAKIINNIFERNNLPLTWKIFKVFELLYPINKIKENLNPTRWKSRLWSPTLNDYIKKDRNVYSLIYRDLMNIAIKSWDRSLRDYLKIFVWSEDLLKKFEGIVSDTWFNWEDPFCLDKKLEEKEQEKLLYLFRRISVLYNRYFWDEISEWNSIEDKKLWLSKVADNQLVEFYNDIKKWFHLREWVSIYDRLKSLLYVNWLKYHSAEEVLEDMNKYKKIAHERGLKYYNESTWWKIKFPEQTFLKWVTEDAFPKIINRWVTCREYLWWWENWDSAWSDCTPFDIDWVYPNPRKEWKYYWNVVLSIDTNRCNIFDTWKYWLSWYQDKQYELFKTWVVGKDHYGIRTWIPMTEIDYIIYNWNFGSKEFQDMCYEIARNGYYIPIVDNRWNIKYNPQMYHNIRLWFNYMEYYDWFDVELRDWKFDLKKSDNIVNKSYHWNNKKINDNELADFVSENSPTSEKYSEFAEKNKKLADDTIILIKKILEEKCWISFNSQFDSSITWAEIHDSWSTWRWTDIPTKDVDLDFTLLLDVKDYNRIDEIRKIIHEEIWTRESNDHAVQEWWNQIKSKINNIWKSRERPNWIPLDLLILKKSQVIDYSSSDAMKEKLEFIRRNLWEKDLDRVRTNVIIMKKLLKWKWCYKKPEWWISWIWVENWIAQNHWSFIEALESFEKIAYWWEYAPWKRPMSLNEFKKNYPIYDAWENYKDWWNDNFVYKIDKEWDTNCYKSILEIIKVLRTEWIDWIRRLIEEYEAKKSEFIN